MIHRMYWVVLVALMAWPVRTIVGEGQDELSRWAVQ